MFPKSLSNRQLIHNHTQSGADGTTLCSSSEEHHLQLLTDWLTGSGFIVSSTLWAFPKPAVRTVPSFRNGSVWSWEGNFTPTVMNGFKTQLLQQAWEKPEPKVFIQLFLHQDRGAVTVSASWIEWAQKKNSPVWISSSRTIVQSLTGSSAADFRTSSLSSTSEKQGFL